MPFFLAKHNMRCQRSIASVGIKHVMPVDPRRLLAARPDVTLVPSATDITTERRWRLT
jgi:hypothetical protein